jgi:hypothetical protein
MSHLTVLQDAHASLSRALSDQSHSAAAASAAACPLPFSCPALSSSMPPVVPNAVDPYSGAHRHVAFVLLAEFDILKGSSLKYQFPRPTQIKERYQRREAACDRRYTSRGQWH